MKTTFFDIKIGAACKVGDGVHASIKRQNQGVLYLSSRNFKDGRLDLSKVYYISEADFAKHFKDSSKAITKTQTGDVALSIIGTIGEPYVIKPLDRFGLSSAVAFLRPLEEEISSEYLYYWLRGEKFQQAVYAIKGGVAQGYVSLEMIRSLPLRKFERSYQNKIVHILSAYDDLIENNTRRIKILEEMAQAIYREWFVNFRFPGHEKVKMVDSSFGEIPEGWEVVTLKDIVELCYGKALKASNRENGPCPVYGSSGVVGCHSNYLVKAPGVIVGRKGNVGSVHWSDVDFYPIDTVYYVKTDSSLFYVYYNFQHQNFINNDAAVPGLNRNQAYSLPFVKPSSQILAAFDAFCTSLFKQLIALNNKNENLRQTRDMLLPKLISGAVDVSALEIEVKALSA